MEFLISLGNWPDSIEVLTILVSVGRISSRHSSKTEVSMGTKAQEVGSWSFGIVCSCMIVAG